MSEATVSLVNHTRRGHVIVLDHPAFREKRWGFAITTAVVIEESKTGTRGTRQVRRTIAGSITLPPGGRVDGLHPAIEHCMQVKALLAAKAVEIVATPQEEPASSSEGTSLPAQADLPRVTLARGRVRSKAEPSPESPQED